MPVCPTVIHIVSPTEFGPIFRCQNLLYRVAIATARRCFSLQCETLDSEPCIKSKAGLASEISSVTETILSPWTVCESPHFGARRNLRCGWFTWISLGKNLHTGTALTAPRYNYFPPS